MKIVTCTRERHAEAILKIFNEAILTSTALYDYQARTMENMAQWFAAKEQGSYPVIGLETEDGILTGFATYGPFRAFPAYKYTVEHSVYVEAKFRRQGLARTLLQELIQRAMAQDFHMMIGGIDADNGASIAMHKSLGFAHCASIKQAGFKFGRWLDLEFYQLILPTPAEPVDG